MHLVRQPRVRRWVIPKNLFHSQPVNTIFAMILLKRCLIGLAFGISLYWHSPVIAGDQIQTITENECARLQDAEIVWDLNKYRWLCCVIKNEDEYETCIPITDMKPLPKTSLKPFPPNTTRTIKPEKQ
jgi:hypothetical protein